MTTNSAMFCEHANEMPAICPCDPDCYCKSNACASMSRRAVHKPGSLMRTIAAPPYPKNRLEHRISAITGQPVAADGALRAICDVLDENTAAIERIEETLVLFLSLLPEDMRGAIETLRSLVRDESVELDGRLKQIVEKMNRYGLSVDPAAVERVRKTRVGP